MKNKSLYKIITLSLILISSIKTYSINEKVLFNKIKEKNDTYLPNDFKATVVSRDISKSLSRIPRRSRRGRMYVQFLYHKKYGERIVVKNVEEIYKDRFAVYLNMYKEFKIFLKKGKKYSSFIRKYKWKIVKNTPGEYIIKMKKHRNRKTDFFLMYVNKKTLCISKVIRYKNNRPRDYYFLYYKRVNRYLIPAVFVFKGWVNSSFKTVTFRLTNIKINTGLKERNFLE